MQDETRRRILKRRAAFLAAAMSTSAGCGPCNPMVCLEPPIAPRLDSGASDAGPDGGASDAGPPDAG